MLPRCRLAAATAFVSAMFCFTFLCFDEAGFCAGRDTTAVTQNEVISLTPGLSKRLALLRSRCSLLSMSERRAADPRTRTRLALPTDVFFVDDTHALAYCHVPKVASTWWSKVFARMAGFDDSNIEQLLKTNSLHALLLEQQSQLSWQLSPSSFRFAFVRHPLDRLVSAFVNKLLQNHEPGFVRSLSMYLARSGRHRDGEGGFSLSRKKDLLFADFVDMVLDEHDRRRVSFGTLHWEPMINLCGLCRTRFDLIGKLETFSSDVLWLSSRFPDLKSHLASINETNASDYEHAGSRQHFMDQLSEEQRRRLCHMYRNDFYVLGYDCDIN